MTLSIPLTVRLKTKRTDVHVEAEVHDLTYRTAIPGGFASASITLDRPLNITPDDIEMFGSLYIYDGRTGATLWEGTLEDPGRGAGDAGETWQITAVGPSAHTRDRNQPYILVDRSLERWHRSRYSTSRAHTETGELPDGLSTEDVPALITYAVKGESVTTSWTADIIYRSIYYAGQLIARIRADVIGDGTSTNYHDGVWGRAGNGTALYSQLQTWSTSTQTLAANLGSVGWDNSINVVSLRSQRDNTNTTADDFTYRYFTDVVVRAVVRNADGTDNLSTSGYNVNNVDPVEVVADLLGRFLPRFDGANAILIGSGVDIEQLAYPDGVTPEQVLEDIGVYDPAFYWAAWETNPETGKYRFEYKPWPTTVRYEASVVDGFDSPGSGADLYNAVHIRWRDPTGRIRSTRRTQNVQELTDAGITRQYYIDLSDETGTDTTAIYAGDNFLAEHRYPPNAGTLRVARPILDNLTGRMVMPWEILPGHLIRVAGVLPRVDALNPTQRDGVTVFKVISVEFSASDVSATLELDSYSRNVARMLASLKARRLRKR